MTTRSDLIRLVELSKTNPNAVECLHERLRTAADWRERQQIEHAIRFAEKNAGC